MAPWLCVVFIAAPLSNLSFVMEKQAQDMVFQVLLLFTRIVALFMGAWIGDLIWAVAMFALGSFFCWLGYLLWIVRVSGNSCSLLLVTTLRSVLWAVVLTSPAVSIYMLSETMWFRITGLLFAGTLISFRYLVVLREVWR